MSVLVTLAVVIIIIIIIIQNASALKKKDGRRAVETSGKINFDNSRRYCLFLKTYIIIIWHENASLLAG